VKPSFVPSFTAHTIPALALAPAHARAHAIAFCLDVKTVAWRSDMMQ
jgi:hypothetical protein